MSCRRVPCSTYLPRVPPSLTQLPIVLETHLPHHQVGNGGLTDLIKSAGWCCNDFWVHDFISWIFLSVSLIIWCVGEQKGGFTSLSVTPRSHKRGNKPVVLAHLLNFSRGSVIYSTLINVNSFVCRLASISVSWSEMKLLISRRCGG